MKGIAVNDDLATDLDRLAGRRRNGLDQRSATRRAQTSWKIVPFESKFDGISIGRADEYSIPCPNVPVQGDDLPKAEIIGRREIDPVTSKSKRAGDPAEKNRPGAKDDKGIAPRSHRVIP